MKFKIKVEAIKDPNNKDPWWEESDKDECTNVQCYAEEMVIFFNETLKPGEFPIRLLEVVVL